ncbi:MAG: NTP transferase domain-containing protein, partial [Syntrophales bacterium LBB04]|nr:NTP transferase domain-containing protein [Syntrophales bacterium LBB04]
MKAIILAGGKGTRLQSVVSSVPKPMAPVGGRPSLEHLILPLKFWGTTNIVLSGGD